MAGLREGIEAVIVALAAQQSSATGEAIDVQAMRQQVFGADAPFGRDFGTA
jgi:hypothetical protein